MLNPPLFAEGAANIQVDWQTESRKILQRECQHDGNLSFTGSIVSDIKAKKIKAAEIHTQSTSASLLGLAISSFEFIPHQFQGAHFEH